MTDKKKLVEDVARMYAENLILYGTDITKKWETATIQAAALQQAYMCGQADAINRKWVPCSEGKPKDMEWVLFCVAHDGIRIGFYNAAANWFSDGDDIFQGGVTAWMPLPEPYKGCEE